MASERPGLLGQIALREGFLTADQLGAAVALRERERGPLGAILVREGFLTSSQLERLLEIQASRFRAVSADTRQGGLFGQLAVRLGYITPERLRECLDEQAERRQRGGQEGLGKLMLRRGYVTAEQFMDLLARQNQMIVACPGCGQHYDLSKIPAGSKLHCSECGTNVNAPGARP